MSEVLSACSALPNKPADKVIATGDWVIKLPDRKKLRPRAFFYGPEKSGKTSFACGADKAIMIPTEDGYGNSPIMTLPSDRLANNWQDCLQAVGTLLKADHDREWVIVDTMNGVVDLCAKHVCDRDFDNQWIAERGKRGFNAFQQGHQTVAKEIVRFMNGLDMLRKERNMGIIMLAHEGLHRAASALGDDYLKQGPDIDKYTWSILARWVDHIGHIGAEFMVNTPDGKEGKGKAIAMSDERKINFKGVPERFAGTRAGLDMPDLIPLNWKSYHDNLMNNY